MPAMALAGPPSPGMRPGFLRARSAAKAARCWALLTAGISTLLLVEMDVDGHSGRRLDPDADRDVDVDLVVGLGRHRLGMAARPACKEVLVGYPLPQAVDVRRRFDARHAAIVAILPQPVLIDAFRQGRRPRGVLAQPQ